MFYFGQKVPIKVPILTLSSALVKFAKFLMSILKQADSSPNFVSLFSVMKDNSSVLF